MCKYCGESVDPVVDEGTRLIPVAKPAPAPSPAAAPAAAPAPAAPAPDIEFLGETRSVAWEDPARRGTLGRWWSTWTSSQFSPSAFWARLPAEGGHRKPISYAWLFSAQMLVFLAPFAALLGTLVAVAGDAPVWAYPAGAAAYLALFPLTYVLVVLGSYLGAALWHLPLRLLGARGGFEATLRTVAYNSGAGVWGLVPFFGGMINIVMSTVGYYHGFRSLHGLSSKRAAFAALLPVIVTFACVALIVAAAIVIPAATDGACHRTPCDW
jgi:hypothetical protein